jgi:hypothetical protein
LGSDSDGSADDAADDAKDGDESGDDGSDDGDVSVVRPTADQLVKGADIIVLRDGEYELGVVQFPSKTEASRWAIKCEDGKSIPLALVDIKMLAAAGEDVADDGAEDGTDDDDGGRR